MRPRLVLIALLGGLGLVATACTAPADDNGESGSADALSAAQCTPKAEQARKDSLNACVKSHTFDYAGCTKPLYAAYDAYTAARTDAKTAIQDVVDSITGAAQDALDNESCAQILKEAGNDFAAAQAAASGSGDSQLCASLRASRAAKIDLDAEVALRTRLGADNAYIALLNQGPSKYFSLKTGIVGCWFKKEWTQAGTNNCSPQSNRAFTSAFNACRKQCPDITATACTPARYGANADVPCGTYAKISSLFGTTCESNAQCSPTAICYEYDRTAARVQGMTCTDSDNRVGVLQAKVTLIEKNGLNYPVSATATDCVVPDL